MSATLAICAKSTWAPAIRREHAIAQALADRDVRTHFIEQPSDIRRALKRPSWLVTPQRARVVHDVIVRPRRTVVPGHRGSLARSLDCAALGRVLDDLGGDLDAVVVNSPWQWRATRRLPRHIRRVVDLADDWRALIPQRADLVDQCYREIDEEADEVIVVAAGLQEAFVRPVALVPNGVSPALLEAPRVAARRPKHMVYVGTLSERFDAALVGDVLDVLPDWTLSIYGPRHFASKDAAEPLDRLLAAHGGQVVEHGVVARDRVAEVIDEADVAVIPNDERLGRGQDSMKLYDYAARGRPVVASGLAPVPGLPASVRVTSDAVQFAAAVRDFAGSDASDGPQWCAGNTWQNRVDEWLALVLGASRLPDREQQSEEAER